MMLRSVYLASAIIYNDSIINSSGHILAMLMLWSRRCFLPTTTNGKAVLWYLLLIYICSWSIRRWRLRMGRVGTLFLLLSTSTSTVQVHDRSDFIFGLHYFYCSKSKSIRRHQLGRRTNSSSIIIWWWYYPDLVDDTTAIFRFEDSIRFTSRHLSCCCFALIGEGSSVAPTVTSTDPSNSSPSMFPSLLRSKSNITFIIIPHVFDLRGFCDHPSLTSSNGEGSALTFSSFNYCISDWRRCLHTSTSDLLCRYLAILVLVILGDYTTVYEVRFSTVLLHQQSKSMIVPSPSTSIVIE